MNFPSANIGPRADSRESAMGQAAGCQLMYSLAVMSDQAPRFERAPAVVGMRGEPRVLAEDLVRRHEIEPGESHGARHVADRCASRRAPRPGAGRNGRCREMVRSEFVTVPSFSPQASAGSSTCASAAVSVFAITSDTTTSSQLRSACFTLSASGRLTTGLVAMIHTALMRPSWMRSNISTAFGPWRVAMVGLLPELLHGRAAGRVLDVDVRGQRVGEAAHLAATHGIGLAGHRERPGARLADAPGGEMTVDDGVDLVGARRSSGSRPARTP